MTSAADIGIRVYLDDAASTGLGSINGNLQRMGLAASLAAGGWGNLSAQMMSTAGLLGLGIAVYGLGDAIVTATSNAVEMQTLLIQIGRATSATSDQLVQMQNVLMDIGGSSIFSLQQLADGFVLLGQRGVTAQDIINNVGKQMTILAEATGTTPVQAAGLLASTLASFNIKASDSAQVVDLLQFAFEHGVPSVDQLTSALAKIGSIAGVLKVPLDQVIPSLDVLSRAMGSGTVAATSLYYFMSQIAGGGTAAFKSAIQELGITFFNAQGNFIGLNQSLQTLYQTLRDKTPEEQGQILHDMFNIKSGTGIDILMQDIGQLGTITDQLAKSHDNLGVATDRAAKIADSAAGLWNGLKTNLQDFLTLIGGPLLAVMQPLLAILNGMSKTLREAAQSNSTYIASALLVATVLGGIAAIVVFASSALGLFTLITVGVATAVLGLAVGLSFLEIHWKQVTQAISIAISTVAPYVLFLVGALLTFRGVILGIQLYSLAQAFISLIPSLITMGITLTTITIPAMITYMVNVARQIALNILLSIIMASQMIPTILAAAGAWLFEAAATLIALAPFILIGVAIAAMVVGIVLLIHHLGEMHVLMAIIHTVMAALIPPLQQAGAAIRGAFMQAVQQLTPVMHQLMDAFNQAKPALIALGIVLGVLLMVAIAILIGGLRAIITIITVLLVTAIQVVAGIIQVFAGLITFFMGIFTVIHALFTGNRTELLAGLSQMGQGIIAIFSGLWSIVVALFVGAFNLIKGTVSSFIGGIIGFFQSLWSALVGHSIIPDMLNTMLALFIGIGPSVLGVFGSMVNGLVGLAYSLGGRILGAVGNLGSILYGAGQAVIQGLINGISSMIGNLIGAASNALNNIRDLFPHSPAKAGPLVDLHTWMPNVVRVLADTTITSGPALQASMSHVAGGIKTGLGNLQGGTGSGAHGETYNLTVDGKVFMSFFHDAITGELQANGVGRLLK